ncbi:hypothetical protein [Crateriforma conspicua]|uniref:Uncharacterized protein n=1 Tax=Crateriforma conspicua TaxID=2527996 RepID=A0A5C5Y229_9PLAN|nr:hypothetical protein [Crateriforma conspicua]TWT68305.1 hypothetical protein Pan14r_05490 [Crateriforma conspicua]
MWTTSGRNAKPFVIASAVVLTGCGLSIPGFYDWTESDQSDQSHLLWIIPLASWSISSVLCFVAGRYWPGAFRLDGDSSVCSGGTSGRSELGQARYGLRWLLMVPLVVAAVIVGCQKIPLATTVVVCIGAWSAWGFSLWRRRMVRPELAVLVLGMMLPFVWVYTDAALINEFPWTVLASLAMPGILTAMLSGQFLESSIHQAEWLPFITTAVHLLFGVVVIRFHARLGHYFILFITHVSLMGSIVLQMLVRA